MIEVTTATIIIGVGYGISATSGAIIATNLLQTLQIPKAVAAKFDGKSWMRQIMAATQPILTPNLVIMIRSEA